MNKFVLIKARNSFGTCFTNLLVNISQIVAIDVTAQVLLTTEAEKNIYFVADESMQILINAVGSD